MNKTELIEYADYLLQTAMYKVDNIEDAEDLVQETLVEALVAIHQNKVIDNPKSWLVSVLHHKYYDMLRRKYRKGTVSMDVIGEIPVWEELSEQMERSEEAENIRCSLAHLTRIYRQVMVRYYIHGESIKQIAKALDIPENTVKSRLDTGRKHVRKDVTMENYTRQSYEPETLWLSNSGKTGVSNEPFSLVEDDKITMNLLILAYEKPVTLPELGKAIGISTTYIEPIVDKLVRGELMKQSGDKVYSDFIIYDENDRTANIELEKDLAEKHYKGIWEIVQQGLDKLHEQDFYQALQPSQSSKLDSCFAVRVVQTATNRLRDEACGGIQAFDTYPDRPNGGKWYAMGSRYPANYDYSGEQSAYLNYMISGVSENTLVEYCGLSRISLCEYDCLLGKTHRGYCGNSVKYKMSGIEVMKMLYAIHRGEEDSLPMINMHCFENAEGLEAIGYLTRNEQGKLVCDVPVLKLNESRKLYELAEQQSKRIQEMYRGEIMQLMQYPVKLPTHLKSVPKWQQYMHCCSTFPMQVIMKAHENGLFFAGQNLQEKPVPAVLLEIAE